MSSQNVVVVILFFGGDLMYTSGNTRNAVVPLWQAM